MPCCSVRIESNTSFNRQIKEMFISKYLYTIIVQMYKVVFQSFCCSARLYFDEYALVVHPSENQEYNQAVTESYPCVVTGIT